MIPYCRAIVAFLAVLALAIPSAQAAPLAHPSVRGGLIGSIQVSPTPVIDREPATITAHVHHGATCGVRVIYASGYRATSRSLRTAWLVGSDGIVQWTWTPATRYPGPARAMMQCQMGRQIQTKVQGFVVQ